MSLDARALRKRRKQRIAARTTTADGDMPDWLEDKLEEDTGEDYGEPGLQEDEEEETAQDDADLMDEGEAVLGAFQYNPIYQKPTHLSSDKPSGGYHYYGPLPDAGTSYGYYVDAESDLGIIAPRMKAAYSPLTGKPMEYQGRVGIQGLASVLAVANDMVALTVGKEERRCSAPLKTSVMAKLFDVLSGRDITLALRALANDDEPMEEMDDYDESMEEMPEEEPPVEPMESMEEEEEEPAESMEEPMAEEPMEEMPEEESPVEPMESMEEDEEEEPPVEPMESMEEEEEEIEPEEAVTYEALTSVDDLDGEPLSEADVHMTLFNEEDEGGNVSANPYWNVDVKGMPIARVFLQDQPKPEEIRRVFCSADYHRGVSEAIEKAGLMPVLRKLNAKIWANRVEETKLARRIRSDVEAEAGRKVMAVTKNLMKDLLHRIAVVCAGMDKNFYRKEGNPLKEALWAEFHRFGISNPSPMVEAGFKKGSTQYFQTVIAKAVEYMEMDPKALGQVQQAIGAADVLPAGDANVGDALPDANPANPEAMPTLSQRLAASSVAIGGIPALAGDAVGEHKRALRDELRLGGAGPQCRRR